MTLILVTGATGFVGSRLCEWLRVAGYEVRAGTREMTGEALVGVDCVVHCAGRAHVMDDKAVDALEAYRSVNVGFTQKVAQWAAESGVKQFIFLSTIKDASDAYGQSKREAESWLRDFFAPLNISLVILRPVLMYGPGVKGNFALLCRWVKRGIPLPLAGIVNQRSFLSLENGCHLIEKVIEHREVSGTFLVADRTLLSTPELIRAIALVFNKKARLFYCPLILLKVICFLTNKKSAFDRLSESLVVDSSATERVFGWVPENMLEKELKNILKKSDLFKK